MKTRLVMRWAKNEGFNLVKRTDHEYLLEGKSLNGSFFDKDGEAICLALLDKNTGAELMYPGSLETLGFFLSK